ncbi:hypothetical protein BGW38_010767 [Lunasporangiospora selenospora]|uniref:Uncharacterized protein n=1 Tax=Lunasporangiospora selenospora TaxID=979761 RepID=A0A9P6FVT7_9FUNG|nr:hypothetical protein BGW38_010767 [Lunasporangiospora selenospora]
MVQDEVGLVLEPCSMWTTFFHAALHYSRLVGELAPIGQKTQIASQLQILQIQDASAEEDSTSVEVTESDAKHWIEQALQGAIAQLLEPASQHAGTQGPTLQAQSLSGSAQLSVQYGISHTRMSATIVLVLADPERDESTRDEDSEMVDDPSSEGVNKGSWLFDGHDLREWLDAALSSLSETIRSSNESSVVEALTNLYLQQNKDVQLVRVHNSLEKDALMDVFYRCDHLKTLLNPKSVTEEGPAEGFLETCPWDARGMARMEFCSKIGKDIPALPTLCAHLASISPSTYSASFSPYTSQGAVHLLTENEEDTVAKMALFDHQGQLFIHCLEGASDSQDFKALESTVHSALKRKPESVVDETRVKEFLESIIRPNSIAFGADSFTRDGNTFTEVSPSNVKQPTAVIDENAPHLSGAEGSSSLGVNMSLVHTTSRLDVETRWLVQWEGERKHPIFPAHDLHIRQIRDVICKSSVDAQGFSVIGNVLDNLVADARPLQLPGDPGYVLTAANVSQGGFPQQQQHQATPSYQQTFRESAQAILADLWMIGQRFKTVSPSHAEAAKLIATKVTPKGVDHSTVKQTMLTPNRRLAISSSASNSNEAGVSPVVDSGDDVWNKNKGSPQQGGGRGGANMGGAGRGGQFGRGGGGGGGAGGAGGGRFNNPRGERGGRGRGGPGGFRGGGHNVNNSPNPNSASGDDMGFGMNVNEPPTLGPSGDILLSLTGKNQPVPYLVTKPPNREEVEESEQDYLAQLGEDGCLLKAYWGTRGSQGTSVAALLNTMHSLDSVTAPPAPVTNLATMLHPAAPIMDPVAQQRMLLAAKNLATKRRRLQDYAGRTPVSENGGFSK